MSTTSGPDIAALFAQLNSKMDSLQGKMDGFQGKMDGFQGKMDTFQDKLTSLEEHQQPAGESPLATHPPERPMETRECNIPGWKPADIGFFYPDMPYRAMDLMDRAMDQMDGAMDQMDGLSDDAALRRPPLNIDDMSQSLSKLDVTSSEANKSESFPRSTKAALSTISD
jgi:hypothetical protein